MVKRKAQRGGLLEPNAEWKKMAAGEHVQYDSNYKELKMYQHYIVKNEVIIPPQFQLMVFSGGQETAMVEGLKELLIRHALRGKENRVCFRSIPYTAGFLHRVCVCVHMMYFII